MKYALIMCVALIVSCKTQPSGINMPKADWRGPGCDVIVEPQAKEIHFAKIVDTEGYYIGTFQVDAPHSNAIHSMAFRQDSTFDYRILDERYGLVDIYLGTWASASDSIHISVHDSWTTYYEMVPVGDSSAKYVISTDWINGSELYYTFDKDTLHFHSYRSNVICFPLRNLSTNCLALEAQSFLHEVENGNE